MTGGPTQTTSKVSLAPVSRHTVESHAAQEAGMPQR